MKVSVRVENIPNSCYYGYLTLTQNASFRPGALCKQELEGVKVVLIPGGVVQGDEHAPVSCNETAEFLGWATELCNPFKTPFLFNRCISFSIALAQRQ